MIIWLNFNAFKYKEYHYILLTHSSFHTFQFYPKSDLLYINLTVQLIEWCWLQLLSTGWTAITIHFVKRWKKQNICNYQHYTSNSAVRQRFFISTRSHSINPNLYSLESQNWSPILRKTTTSKIIHILQRHLQVLHHSQMLDIVI